MRVTNTTTEWTRMGFLVGLVSLLLTLASATATPRELGRRIPYSGLVTGLTGTAAVDFAIYDAATGGNLLWGPESHQIQIDANGRFAAVVGSALPPIDFDDNDVPDLDELDVTGALHIQVSLRRGTQVVTLAPRQALFAAAHAVSAEVSDFAVGFAPDAVDALAVSPGAISVDKIADEPGVQFPDSFFPDTSIPLGGAVTTVGSVAVDAPAPGFVIADAFGTLAGLGNDLDVECGITLSPVVIDLTQAIAPDSTLFDFNFFLTRGFPVSAGTTLVYLACSVPTVSADSGPRVESSSLTVFYSPTRY